jgi:cytochrome c oxidase cbb3-type subunit 3
MKPRAAAALLLASAAALFLLAACEREVRRLEKPQQPLTAVGAAQTPLHPGAEGAGPEMTSTPRAYDERNAFEISQGKRLYKWFNCNGCHAGGGGGMGPSLMDEKWLYGSAPAEVFATIMEGRPNGMPAFRGRLPEEQAWQLVAYVRSMPALTPKGARPGRGDSMQTGKSESRRERQEPKS